MKNVNKINYYLACLVYCLVAYIILQNSQYFFLFIEFICAFIVKMYIKGDVKVHKSKKKFG